MPPFFKSRGGGGGGGNCPSPTPPAFHLSVSLPLLHSLNILIWRLVVPLHPQAKRQHSHIMNDYISMVIGYWILVDGRLGIYTLAGYRVYLSILCT